MKRTILAVTLFAVAQGAVAQAPCINLLYVGAPFSTVVVTGNPTYNSTANGPLTGTITLASPLPANGVNTAVTLTAFDFSTVYPTFNSAIPSTFPYAPPAFTFTTVNGVITDWTSTFDYNAFQSGTHVYDITGSSQPTGDSVSVVTNDPDAGLQGTIAATSTARGTWSCVTSYNAPYQAAPTPPPVNPLAATVAALQAQVAALQAMAATAQAQIVALKGQLAAAQSQVAKLTSEVSAVIAERNEIEAQEIAVSRELAAAKVNLTADSKEIALLRAEIIALEKARR
jgi:hypothetical protein